MLKKIFESRNLIKNVLSKRNYFILFICSSAVLFLIFYILTLATTTNQSIGIFVMMNGLWFAISSFFLLAVAAFLFGIYMSLLAFKIKNKAKKGKIGGIGGTIGVIVGLFGAGCPMCGGVLFALIGMPLALFFLPFKGLELRLASIILMSVSVYILGRNLISCKNKK